MASIAVGPPSREALPDGVYLNLPEDAYFGQDALGSSDLVSLFKQRWGWWWGSRYNPRRVEKPSKEREFGTALHAIILEGLRAYESRYAVAPDPAGYDGLLTKIDQYKEALRDAGYVLSGTSLWRAAEWRGAMRANLPHVPVWENIMEDFSDGLGDRLIISAEDDEMLRFMREVAVDTARADNTEIRQLFADDNPALAEVSVFWTEGGVRRRARLDRMFPAFDLDLKSMGTWSGRPLAFEVGEIVARRGLDIQRADHFDARAEIYRAIAEGRVYGGSPEERNWLSVFPQAAPKWDYVWLFYQKPDPKGRAPVIFPVFDESWDVLAGRDVPSEVRDWGMAKKAVALDFYRQAVRQFGLDRPWATVEPVHYTREVPAKPRIIFPPWIAQEHPETPDAYDGGGED